MKKEHKNFSAQWKHINDTVEQWLDLSALNDLLGSVRMHKTPSVNVWEDEQGLSLLLAAPGLSKEDFRIELEEDLLSVSVEKSEKEEGKAQNYSRREFDYSKFTRSFRLDKRFDSSTVQASYEQGQLLIRIAAKEEKAKQKRRIDVL